MDDRNKVVTEMKTYTSILTAALLLIGNLLGFAQGFINFNFEQAQISNLTTNSYGVFGLAVCQGWTAYHNGEVVPYLDYNDLTLGSERVGLEGTNNARGLPAIQGKYFILLGGSSESFPHSAAIGQTGMIPSDAKSLTFQGSVFGPAIVTFNGQVLPLVVVGNIPNYAIYGADVSSYAGQTGELLFTGLGGSALNPSSIGGFILDNLQFSSTPVPEPNTLALAALGTLIFCWRRAKN